MANYATLKTAIQNVINTNGNNEITGLLLQQTLFAMVESLGNKYQYAGVATLTPTATNPGTPDQNVFYIASQPGTYGNFSNLTIAENEVAIFKYNGTWSKETTGCATSESVHDVVSRLSDLIITTSISADVDFMISDGAGHIILKLKDGDIITKNFNSKGQPLISTSNFDYEISDGDGNILFRIKNGEIISGNFDSSKMPNISDSNADYEISDNNGNILLRLRKGHIKTKYFDSENAADNPLFGKTIVWYGTSIPQTGYPQICGDYLGAIVHNEAVGGSHCRMGYSTLVTPGPLGDPYGITGTGWTSVCTSLSMKQEEKHDIFENWTTARRKANLIAQGYTQEQVANVKGWGELLIGNPPADIMDSSYDNYRKMSYGLSYNTYTDIEPGLGLIEGKVDKYLNDEDFPDLWVFDHGHNDNEDSAELMKTIPTPDNDRTYFIGAMNYIIEHILEFNPRARIVFIGHYENEDNGGSFDHSKVCEAQVVLADYWNAPLYKAWEMFGMNRSRVITTNAYWDENGVWHRSGFDGTNGYKGVHYGDVPENIRQIDGVWVHDMTLTWVHMLDGLHPEQDAIKEFIGHSIAKFMQSLIVTF